MGIIERFGDIMRSNVNALLDKCEDPAKMVDQMLLDARRDLAEVKNETAAVMAVEKSAKRQLDSCQTDIDKCVWNAEQFIKAGDDDGARKWLARKQELESAKASYQVNYDAAKANADKMREMYEKLSADVQSLEIRRGSVKAKMSTAKAMNMVNQSAARMGSSKAMDKFSRMEARADELLDKASAMAELSQGGLPDSDLPEPPVPGGSVDDELAAMKARLAGGQG